MQSFIKKKRQRRAVIAWVIGGPALTSMMGCGKPSGPVDNGHTYRERIENILFSPSHQKLIVLGERFHYSFDDRSSLSRILGSSFSKDLAGTFGLFVVDPSNRISGFYTIESNRVLSSEEGREAESLGFRKVDSGKHRLSTNIDGIRHTTAPLSARPAPLALSREYTVEVRVVGGSTTVPAAGELHRLADSLALIMLSPLIVLALFSDPCITCK